MPVLFSLLLAWLFMVPITSLSVSQPEHSDIAVSPVNTLNVFHSSPPSDTLSPDNFRWVERWAAIGDSFTAGIGSGQLYSKSDGDTRCSRYDRSYPALIERRLGPSVKVFEYLACSGARTGGIFQQALSLRQDLDLVVLSAGGNDLCLSSILTTCIFLPFQGEKACQDILDKAQENIDTILKQNLRQVLSALNSKVKKNGIIVFALYAQYFNTQNNECADKQDWSFPQGLPFSGLKLTIERRQKFNNLVANINKAIKEVIHEYQHDPWIKYRITYADWEVWAREAVKGQFCVPGTTRAYPDDWQPDLHFFRPSLRSRGSDHDELKKKGLIYHKKVNETEIQEDELAIYNTFLYKSANPAADALKALEPRTPTPPGCPGDDKASFGIGLPDRWGKLFHPNELGHRTMASFVMEAIIAVRSGILGIEHPICKQIDQFNCNSPWVTDHRYLSTDVLTETVKTYCKEVVPREGQKWADERLFYKGTPEAHTYRIEARAGVSEYSEQQCLLAFNRIIHGCNRITKNPMNFKLGGSYYFGSFRYILRPVGKQRPWPVIEKPYGKCEGNDEGSMSTYTLYGAGWASSDRGRKFYKAMSDCIGWTVNSYSFKYFDRPDKDGYEWKMIVHWPDHVKKCFRNDKVQKEAGGTTGGCLGTD
ncbi:uncharacterized protein DSM5745_02766 [Aspergillus mulundensis]|uniref:SGNH hydrolase-type esterase domain-containing protein n=1 Tax=Aspergillus mulundensis TaxID=1810919 RepID=A0A3D8SIW5_9EURO|nr:hypothetical protein DSM5745_02766 [Aspergillus mulundensis]RDW86124.1 hypothetical protein DSM5745_02766 [Aspergillus mulundensis]